jgi:hypothetical protein
VTGDGKFLERLVRALDSAGIAYMVAGSVGSNLYGHPRTTNDIDIIISASEAQIDEFLTLLGDTYVNIRSGQQAIKDGMFNVIDFGAGMKADLVLLKEREFSRTEFARRRVADIEGVKAFVVTAEDAILSKLEWSKMGESERQFRDAFNVVSLMWDELDMSYLKKWAVELKVEDLLARLLDEAKPPPSGGV